MNVIGIGTDIVECVRIAKMIEKHGETFLTRVFTQSEIAYCGTHKASTQHYAGRWAAKEAVLKALGTGLAEGIHWTDIEVRRDAAGKPSVAFAGGARTVCERKKIHEIQLSISHCHSHATAFAVAIGFPAGGSSETAD